MLMKVEPAANASVLIRYGRFEKSVTALRKFFAVNSPGNPGCVDQNIPNTRKVKGIPTRARVTIAGISRGRDDILN